MLATFSETKIPHLSFLAANQQLLNIFDISILKTLRNVTLCSVYLYTYDGGLSQVQYFTERKSTVFFVDYWLQNMRE